MTLDQLMAFTVSGDHERQEQVFERLAQSYSKEAYVIRRMMTEGAVRASDKRAQFVGLDAYEEAGGTILRDLFQGDDGGWLQDVSLIDSMVAQKLREEAAGVQAEGWKWVEVAPDFAYGHVYGLRQLRGEPTPLTPEEDAARAALQAEYDGLEAEHAGAEELPEGVDARLAELETALASFEARPLAFDPAEVARAGAFVSIDGSGALRVERGYVRPKDELPIEPEVPVESHAQDEVRAAEASLEGDDPSTVQGEPEPDEDEGLTPISDRLMTELTAHRTLALRHALGERPDVAFLAALHALSITLFYRYGADTCLELELKSVSFGTQAPGLNDSVSAKAVAERHQAWIAALPKEPGQLWDTLQGWESDSRSALLAHCVALSVNAVHETWSHRPRALAHADRLAQAVDLDMAAAGWTPTVDTFLGRVTKARILGAVCEAKGERAAARIAHLKKGEMADQAEALLAGSGWLPEPLRTPGCAVSFAYDGPTASADASVDPAGEETAADGGEPAMVDENAPAEDEPAAVEPPAIAAE